MITWPIFVAFVLAVIAVYFSVKAEDLRENKRKSEAERKANKAHIGKSQNPKSENKQ